MSCNCIRLYVQDGVCMNVDAVLCMQGLFDKLMELTRSARDDYSRLTSNVVQQNTSNVSQSCPVEQRAVSHQASDNQDVVTACVGQLPARRNGFISHSSSYKNGSAVPPANGLQDDLVEKISSLRCQSSSSASSSNHE